MRIIDLAERMIRLSGCQVGIDIPIQIIGSRPGEKLNEVLSTPDEEILATSHPYINRLVPTRAPADVFAAELEELELATLRRDEEAVRTPALHRRDLRAGTATGRRRRSPGPGRGRHHGPPFEWPELDDAEADLDLAGMVTRYAPSRRATPARSGRDRRRR